MDAGTMHDMIEDLMVELAIARAKLEEMTIDRDYWRDSYRQYQ